MGGIKLTEHHYLTLDSRLVPTRTCKDRYDDNQLQTSYLITIKSRFQEWYSHVRVFVQNDLHPIPKRFPVQ